MCLLFKDIIFSHFPTVDHEDVVITLLLLLSLISLNGISEAPLQEWNVTLPPCDKCIDMAVIANIYCGR